MGGPLNWTLKRYEQYWGAIWVLLLLATPLVVVLAATGASSARAAETKIIEIGETIDVQRRVTGQLLKSKRRLKKGMPIRLNEILETGKKARGEFRFKDDTKLAVGPNSKIVLDTFIYDPGSSKIIHHHKYESRGVSLCVRQEREHCLQDQDANRIHRRQGHDI